MKIVADFNEIPAIEVFTPANLAIPFVFCSPHSGCFYPKSFLNATQLNAHDIRRSEDAYVDFLFSDVVDYGATLIRANFPRAYLDVNREPYEFDPGMFDVQLPSFINTDSKKAANGIGTIARIVEKTQEIYHQPLNLNEALGRIETCYKPFHQILQQTLDDLRDKFGYAVLVDCHSMPTISWDNKKIFRPDLILGDRFGKSCPQNLTEVAENIFRSLNFSVGRNNPFAGGYITKKYGIPDLAYYAIQIEISRNLYLNEAEITLTPQAKKLKTTFAEFANQLTEKFIPDSCNYMIAAE